MQTQDLRDAYYRPNCTSQLLSVSNRHFNNSEEPQLDSFSYAFITSFLQLHAHITTSYENMTFQSMNSTLLSFLLFVMNSVWVSPWEFHPYMPVQSWQFSHALQHLNLHWYKCSHHGLRGVQWTNLVSSSRAQDLSVNRLWGDDSKFSWASVYYCMVTLQCWLTAHCSSSKTAR